MYKSLLSPEELNELLSTEQASELAAASEQQRAAQVNVQKPKQEEYLQRMQQLESDMQQLLSRVGLLEAQLKEYGAANDSSTPTKVQHVEESSISAPEQAPEPIRLSRVEKYKQIPKKSLFG